ncbi:iron ABC transporter permease [Flavobacterium sp. DG1-102-2]|uniref:iron ABC transporter permease n=1 Tax=Flavobacterium sp. DG1-102-2 TaxID=3081663 RepID=UPI002949033D|nr:iron ABC transporter permease [Flavobacterium sp. DG1-102-2]MDV6168016.1 iron ABC transporter permease [Flavobacterium sp. DG1-102-2]
MHNKKRNIVIFTFLGIALLFLFLVNISAGSVKIPLKDVFLSLTGGEASKSTWQYIVLNYRLPKAITALLVGMGLSVSGLLMQTLFRNPLAGPDVLGLSSGASLGVAFVILGAGLMPPFLAHFFLSPYGIVLASTAGSFLVLLAVLVVSQRMRDTMAILIIGLMFSSFAGAIVNVLTFFSSAEELQKYTFWTLGSLGNLPWQQIILLFVICIIGLLLAAVCIKPLDALLLGERYAKSMGINFSRTRIIIILAASLLTGTATAFTGPIAFIGLVVPHIAKLFFKTSSHVILYGGTLLLGAIILLVCDTFTQIPGSQFVLPINAITSIIGAPIVIWLLMRKQKANL